MESKQSFDDADRRAAREQGWEILHTFDMSTQRWVMGIFPADQRLPSPHHAKALVWNAAKLGDALCRKALAFIAASEIAAHPPKKRKAKK